jgi:LemA protein
MGILIALLVLGGIGLAILVYIVSLYNGLVALRNRFKNAFAQIDVQLKRRYDLIPNLVETAKSFMAHEKDTLEAVIRARNTASAAGQMAAANPGDASAINNLSTAEVALAGSMNKFIGLSEAYPELRSNQNTENKISFARQAFNDSVAAYNTAIESFPGNIVAGFGQFERAAFFEISEPQQREAVKVQF